MKGNAATQTWWMLVVLELLFTSVIGAAIQRILGLQVFPTLVLFGALMGLRVLGYWWLLTQLFQPSIVLHRRAASGRDVSAVALQTADSRLQNAPRGVATFSATAWALAFPITAAIHHLAVGPVEQKTMLIPTILLLGAFGLAGATGIVTPMLIWTTAGTAGQNYLLAQKLDVDVERSPRSVAGNLGLLGLCVIAAPLALLLATSLSAQSRAAVDSARRDSVLLGEALRHLAAEQGAEVALASLAKEYPIGNATLFAVVPSTKPTFVGMAPPRWADAGVLTAAADGAAEIPDRAAFVTATRLEDGGIVGVITSGRGIDPEFLVLILLSAVVLSLYGPISTWLLSRSVSVPLAGTAELARRAATVGDLSAIGALPVARLDEVGMVALNLNELLDAMRAIATAAREVGDGDLAAELDGNGELPAAFRRMLEQLRALVGEMHSTSTELASAAAEISAASQEQDAASTSHSAGMAEISQTMDSLSDSATHVARAVQGVLENAERTLQNTDQMVTRIGELTGHANRIGDILEVIREIAERTDLLALNGSLEASRAGESGVGFSIVASEMRRLAERVKASTGDIKSLVEDIRESGAYTVVATEESKKLAQGTTQAARGITLVTQQQQSSTEQVTLNVRSVAEVVRQTATATSQTRTSAEGLKEQADRLAELVGRFRLA